MKHEDSLLDPRGALRDAREVFGCRLVSEEIGRVVARDDREKPGFERAPERPGRVPHAEAGEDVLRALLEWSVEGALVEEEVLRAGLAPRSPSALTRLRAPSASRQEMWTM